MMDFKTCTAVLLEDTGWVCRVRKGKPPREKRFLFNKKNEVEEVSPFSHSGQFNT